MVSLFVCGDIMPGGVLPYQEEFITARLQSEMNKHDFRIGTLEAAIGTNIPFDATKMAGRQNIIYARDPDLLRVKKMGFDAVSLANNHIHDLGDEGVKNTVRQLDSLEIRHCGAGINSEQAHKVVVLDKGHESIAVLAYCVYGSNYLGYVDVATEDKCGVNGLDLERCLSEIKEAKQLYDYVVVLPHWGKEYQENPLAECVSIAKQMIDAGADAVMGSHPHRVQPTIRYKHKPICFSMGNFLFPDFFMEPPRPIWYPENREDILSMNITYNYPYPITEPTRRVWKEYSRIGHGISITFSNKKVTARVLPTRLSENNIIDVFLPSFKERVRMVLSAKRIEHPALDKVVGIINKICAK